MKELRLTKGMVAYVDDDDFVRVSKFKWMASGQGSRGDLFYAKRKAREYERSRVHAVHVFLHHFVLDIYPRELRGFVIDHINGDSLDNRKHNLQIITQEQNMAKSPGWRK